MRTKLSLRVGSTWVSTAILLWLGVWSSSSTSSLLVSVSKELGIRSTLGSP